MVRVCLPYQQGRRSPRTPDLVDRVPGYLVEVGQTTDPEGRLVTRSLAIEYTRRGVRVNAGITRVAAVRRALGHGVRNPAGRSLRVLE